MDERIEKPSLALSGRYPKEGSKNLAKEGVQQLDHVQKLAGFYKKSFDATRQIVQTHKQYSAIRGWHVLEA
jgi:hypothetical protein